MRSTSFRALTLLLAASFVTACGGSDDDAAVQTVDRTAELEEWVDAAEEHAEDKDRRGLLSMISENYADGRGNDREKVGNIMRAYFLRQESVALLTTIDDIEMMGDDAALVNLTVGMAGTNANGPGVRAHAYNFELELENPGDEWVLIGARWGRVGRDMK